MATSPNTKYRINLHIQERRSRYYAEDLGNGILLKMVEIPGGTFVMGSPTDEVERMDREGPQHEVTLGDFFMGMYPITQAQWQAVAAFPQEQQTLDPHPSRFKGEDHPVEQVTWDEAVEFCARLSTKTRRAYRLPTEAEWEYACRAGTTTPFHFGDTITTELANYDGTDKTYGAYDRGPKGIKRGQTTPVGSFPANAFGLYDMHGNVWEWCADHWHDNYADKPNDLKLDGNTPWTSTNERANRSLRGGSWNGYPRLCRSAIRVNDHPGERLDYNGFRVVCRAARTLP
ncbi:formylglycine-generating enzyme family protein [Pantanalinema rosaneae CENA516]|uniref:formylglycine-generating enzyme family protein n=1 Tax=Pantanalinema rosaneae TaxID=1620701 RepID=UPI003D6E1F67